MRTLKFKCTGQKLKKDPACDFGSIVRGSKGYLQIYVDFDSEWSETVRAAEFYIQGNSKDVYPTLIKDGFCNVRDEVTDSKAFTVRIVGKKGDQKIITNKVTVRQGV